MYKKISEALVEAGFKKNGKYFERDGLSIKIYPDTTLTPVFKQLIDFGKTMKIWEIKKVIEID